MPILYFVKAFVLALLGAIELLMFLRAICGFIPSLASSSFAAVAVGLTEPLIFPVRLVVEKSETLRNMPIDMSFFITFFIITLIESALA